MNTLSADSMQFVAKTYARRERHDSAACANCLAKNCFIYVCMCENIGSLARNSKIAKRIEDAAKPTERIEMY